MFFLYNCKCIDATTRKLSSNTSKWRVSLDKWLPNVLKYLSLKKGLTILNEYDIKILYKNVRDYVLYIYTCNISCFGCLLHYCGCKKYQYVSHRYETTHIGGYPFYPDKRVVNQLCRNWFCLQKVIFILDDIVMSYIIEMYWLSWTFCFRTDHASTVFFFPIIIYTTILK